MNLSLSFSLSVVGMSLTYLNLSKRPQGFNRLTGVSLSEFGKICNRIVPLWESSVEAVKKPQGRVSVLKTLEDKLMSLLIYYRTYITHEFLGHLCGLHNSNIGRLFKKLEPILGKRLADLPKKKWTDFSGRFFCSN